MYADGRWDMATVYDRARLEPDMTIDGPAIVEQIDSTTLLLDGDCGRVDEFRNLIIRVGG